MTAVETSMDGATRGERRGAEGVALVLAARATAAQRERALSPRQALAHFDRAYPAGPASARAVVALSALALALGGRLTEGPPALRGRVRDALRDGRALALREGRGAPRAASRAGESADARTSAPPPPREAASWITIQLVDDDDPPRAVAFARYRVTLPDDSVREGRLDGAGLAHLDGIDAGLCAVTFPDYDQDAWARVGESPPPGPATPEGAVHRVAPGDSTESLAAARGLFWRSVWAHPRNALLRAVRDNANVLRPGDALFLPARVVREAPGATERLHAFKLRGVPSRLAVRCLDLEGNARAGEPYRLTARGVDLRGVLDGDGWLRVRLMPDVARAELWVGEEGGDDVERHVLLLGHLDPASYLEGCCDRLHNLGYYDGPRRAEPDAALLRAVARFRGDHGLDPEGGVDDAFREALAAAHGDVGGAA